MSSQPLHRQIRLWTILIVLVPSLLIMLIYTVFQVKAAKVDKQELISQRIDFQTRLINYWIDERSRDVRELSRLEIFRSLDQQQMKKALDLKQQEYKEFDSISYIDKEGFFRMSTLPGGIRFASTAGTPYFEAASRGQEFISDVVIGRNSGLPIINISSPIYGPNGSFQGLILGSVRTITIENLLRSNWFGRTGEILLVNREGTMIAEPRYIDELIKRGLVEGSSKMTLKLSREALASIQVGETGYAGWNDYLGSKVIGSYRYLPQRGWTLVGSISEEEILAPIYAQLAIMSGSTFLVVLLLLPLATRLTNRIKRPIEWLTGQAALVAKEDYAMVGQDKRLTNMPYELAALCDAFVTMGRKIQSNMGQLKEHETKLEEQVLEIQKVNAMLEREAVERREAQAALQRLNAGLRQVVDGRTSELRQSEERFYKAFHLNPSMMMITDVKSGRIIDVNQCFATTFGYTREEIIGKNTVDIGLWVDNSARYEVQELLLKQGRIRSLEIKFLTKEQDTRIALISVDLLTLENQECALSVLEDITEKSRIEADMARLGRLNIVGEMAVSIGHEVRNPMTTVRGYLQMFQMKEVFANHHEQINTMIEELDRANSIITEFLSLAKDKAIAMKRANLNHVLGTLYPLMQADAIRRGHEIYLSLGQVPEIDFDEKEIRQLILNLVRNALEAMIQSGTVTIRTYLEDSNLILSVKDTGIGIPDEVMAKLGTPFVTTKEGGTGLGLPVCYRIAERHGAVIEVHTGPEGTNFAIRFPLHAV